MDIATMISNVGFPIAACIVMAMYVKSSDEKHTEEIKTVATAVNAMKDSIDQLRYVIETLKEKVD